VVSELAFTFYVGVYDLSNLIGHYFKILSFYLVYKAIIETGLVEPFSLLLRDLKQAEEALRKVNETLEGQVKERTSALLDANVQLRQEIWERQNVEASLRESEKNLRYLASQILQVQEQERGRISRELHDDLGQSLAALKLTMRQIARSFSNHHNPMTEDLENALAQLDSLIDKIRRISRNLSPAVLEDFGLETALKSLFRDFSATEELKISIDMEKVSPFLSKTSQIAIYRIFQEALTNICKHAAATEVSVHISRQNGHIHFLVTDNGQGFDLAATKTILPGERGLGLASMEERVHMLNGVSEIRSRLGHGTQVSFTLPYESPSP